MSEKSGWGPDLDQCLFDKGLLQARIDELERFVMAEGECHVSFDEFERLLAENRILRKFCYDNGVTEGDIVLALAQR